MKKKPTFTQTLEEILSKQEFDRLHTFKSVESWSLLSEDERNLLGILFVAEGELFLKSGEQRVVESFALASKASPENPIIFYRQALAYATQETNLRCLNEACTALEIATKLAPAFFEAWQAWGNILTTIGRLTFETHYFQEAHHKFLDAQKCIPNLSEHLLAVFSWDWALSWHSLGKLSGEAYDFRLAIKKYQEAEKIGLQQVGFWTDYANAVAELAQLLGNSEMLFESLTLYQNGLALSTDYFPAWFNQACNYQCLYEIHREHFYFDSANESFERAADLEPENSLVWLHWGTLFADAGRIKGDPVHYKTSFDYFNKANTYDPNNHRILSRWSEAQMMFGRSEENIKFLRSAEEKIVQSLKINSESSESWYIYGSCLSELGHYFEDEKFYLQAIEKFHYGLTLQQNSGNLWCALALTYFAIGELRSDVKMLETSIHHFSRALEFGAQIFAQFWNDWGVALLKLSEISHNRSLVESAIEKFEHALAIHEQEPEQTEFDPEWLYNYGCAYDFLGDYSEDGAHYEKAIMALAKVLQLDPTYTQAHYNLALALSHLGELIGDVECLQKSLEHFQLFLNDNSEDEQAWSECGVTLINLAQVLNDPLNPLKIQKLHEQADDALGRAVGLGCRYAFYHLACLHSLMGNQAAAMHFIERTESAGMLPSIDDIMHDEWLEGLRKTREFTNFITHKMKDLGS